MARFSISMSVEVEADSYDEAFEIQADLFRKLGEHPEVVSGPYGIDVEQTSDLEEEDE